MKYILLSTALLGSSVGLHAMHNAPKKIFVKLPSAEIIAQRLSEQNLDDFVKKTEIDKILCHEKMHLNGVIENISNAIKEYEELAPLQDLPKSFKNDVAEAILADYPKEVQILYDRKVLKK